MLSLIVTLLSVEGESTDVVTMDTLRLTTMSVTNNQPLGLSSAAATRNLSSAANSPSRLSQNAYNNLPATSTSLSSKGRSSSSRLTAPQSSFRFSAVDYDDMDDTWLRQQSKDVQSFTETMVSQNWYLPSLSASVGNTVSMQGSSMVVSDENSQFADAENHRSFLRSLFQTDESAARIYDDNEEESLLTEVEEEAHQRRKRTAKTAVSTNTNAAVYRSKRNLLATPALSASMSSLDPNKNNEADDQVISRQKLALPGVDASLPGQNLEKKFLFLNNLLGGDRPRIKANGKNDKNPLLKLSKIRQHFTDSPIALMTKKQQNEIKQHPLKLQKTIVEKAEVHEVPVEDSPGTQKSSFFFASLLGPSVNNVPNIGPTSYPLIDAEELRALVLPGKS